MATQAEIKKYLYDTFSNYMLTENPLADDSAKAQIDKYAVMLSEAIGNSIGSGGGSGDTPILADYVKKSGGIDAVMLGLLTANNKFKAGDNNITALDIHYDSSVKANKINLTGLVDIISESVFLNGKKLVVEKNNELSINGGNDFTGGVSFGSSVVKIDNELRVGSESLIVSNSSFSYNGYNIYHQGNANTLLIDWNMLNGVVGGNLNVNGITTLGGNLSALNGADIGFNGLSKLSPTSSGIIVNGNIEILQESSIVVEGVSVIQSYNNGSLNIRGTTGDLMLNEGSSSVIRLMTSITNDNAQRELITRSGSAFFLWGFQGGDSGVKTIESINENDEYKTRVIGSLDFNSNTISLKAYNSFLQAKTGSLTTYIGDEDASFNFKTDGLSFIFNKPSYSHECVGVIGTGTRMEDGIVYIGTNASDGQEVSHYLQNMIDGMRVHGKLYFTDDISTERFASGFSGYGTRIEYKRSHITADFLTIRRKFKVFEMEIEKISVINGSLWVSSACSGDTVTEII